MLMASSIGIFPLYVVQIADVYISKIECWIKKGKKLSKGQRYGRIIMGSQVDLIFPAKDNVKIKVEEFQDVKAGESIIATY